jgi:hypothetical protein
MASKDSIQTGPTEGMHAVYRPPPQQAVSNGSIDVTSDGVVTSIYESFFIVLHEVRNAAGRISDIKAVFGAERRCIGAKKND